LGLKSGAHDRNGNQDLTHNSLTLFCFPDSEFECPTSRESNRY
jgi:hypothetical protein